MNRYQTALLVERYAGSVPCTVVLKDGRLFKITGTDNAWTVEHDGHKGHGPTVCVAVFEALMAKDGPK